MNKYPLQSNSELAQHRGAFIPIAIFFLSTFFARLGIWVSGFPFPVVFILSPFILALGFNQGQIKLCPRRLLVFVFFAGSVIISSIWGNDTKPTASLMYLMLYSPWLLYSPASHENCTNYLRRIAFYVSLICILGMIQYFSQFVVKLPYMFSWEGLVPPNFLIEHASLNETSYASGVYKGNGFFLLEPSSLSMLAARVLLLVVLLLRDIRYIFPLVLGLAFSLSGTGLVFTLSFTAIPLVYLFMKNRRISAVEISIGLAAAVALVAVLLFYQDYYLHRFVEFSEEGSSAHARYTSTITAFNEHVTRSLGSFLLGYGPGSFSTLTAGSFSEEHDTGWIKLFVELGLVGILSFCSFFLVCVYSAVKSWYIAVAMLFQYVILDSGVLSPQFTFLAFSMYVFLMCGDPEDARAQKWQGTDRLIRAPV